MMRGQIERNSSMTRFGENHHFDEIKKSLAIFEGFFTIWHKFEELIWHFLKAVGQIFISVNGQD